MAESHGLDRLVPRILAATLALVPAGCSYQEDVTGPAHRVPLSIVGLAPQRTTGHPSAAPTVAVSVICSSGWKWLPLAIERDVPFNHVQIERIELLNPDEPTLYVPRTGSRLIWGLLFYKSEQPGFAIFRPDYEPAFQLCSDRDPPFGITWDPMFGVGRAIYTAPPLQATANTSPTQPPQSDHPTAVTAPTTTDPLARLIADRPFWQALRSRYESGADRAAITVICHATLLAAAHRSATDPQGLHDAGTLDWCRSVASHPSR